MESLAEKSKRGNFGEAIKKMFGDSKAPPDGWIQRRKEDNDGLQYDDDHGLRIDEVIEDHHI